MGHMSEAPKSRRGFREPDPNLAYWLIVVIGLIIATAGLGRFGPAAPEVGKGETKRNNLVIASDEQAGQPLDDDANGTPGGDFSIDVSKRILVTSDV